jgi:hypothetical protein
MNKYRCFMKSVPGALERYEGFVDVWASSDDWDIVFEAACRELRRTAFPDRNRNCWSMTDFLLLGRGAE